MTDQWNGQPQLGQLLSQVENPANQFSKPSRVHGGAYILEVLKFPPPANKVLGLPPERLIQKVGVREPRLCFSQMAGCCCWSQDHTLNTSDFYRLGPSYCPQGTSTLTGTYSHPSSREIVRQ